MTTPLAQARTSHTYESVITEVPSETPGGKPVTAPGLLEEVNYMTVHSGDLYVGERIEGEGINGQRARTDQWRPSASKPGEYEFVSQLPPGHDETAFGGITFGAAAGETEMLIAEGFQGPPGVNVFAAGACGSLECASFQTFWSGAGAPLPFEGVGGVVADHSTGAGTSAGDWASGDVFVNAGGGVIDIFEPKAGGEEHYVERVTGVSGPIAVSGFNGDLVVGNQVFSPKEEAPKKGKYALACQLERSGVPLEGIGAVAVDDSTGEIYVSANGPVYEFDSACKFLGAITGLPKEGTPGGEKGQTEEVPLGGGAIAVDPESHRVFVGEHSGSGVVDAFGPDLIVPDVATEAPANPAVETDSETGATSWSVQATGKVNALGEGEASCRFAWGLLLALGRQASCPGTSGASPVPVRAGLTGLEPDTQYFYRLQSTNSNGADQGEASETYGFTTPGPGLRAESVSDVSSSSATFEGTVALHNRPNYPPKLEGAERVQDLQGATSAPTSYYFQYSTQPTSVCVPEPGKCASAPLSPASAGSGTTEEVNVSQHVQGLAANTTYHYRLVAENEALPEKKPGELVAFYGPDRTFTTQGAGGPVVLSDNRAWELVSPADKHGAQLELAPNVFAAEGGGHFTFLMNGATEAAPPGNPTNGVQVLSTRTAPGVWSSVDIALSRSQPEGKFVESALTPEFRWFSEDLGLAVAVYKAAFTVPEGWHQNELGEWEHFVESTPVPTERTPYLRHNTTCSSAPASCYEPLLDSEDVTSGLKHEAAEETGGRTLPAGAALFGGGTPDGSHLFIRSSVQLTRTKAPEGEVWYEWSADKPPAQRLSLVTVAPGGEPLGSASLVAFATDGSRVFFTSRGASYMRDTVTETTMPLPGFAAASSDGSRVLAGGEVYEVNDAGTSAVASQSMVAKIAGGGFGPLVGASRDLASVYFIDTGVLPGTNAKAGADNLYVARYDSETREWTTSFIASPPKGSGLSPQVSPDGRWLAFESETSLTGYDNRGPRCVPIYNGIRQVIGYEFGPCNEVYLYDAQAGRLVCASCDPSGARPVGHSSFLGGGRFKGGARALFDTGRLFFNSGDALVPQDINGNTDLYEYEPPAFGDCTPASNTFNTATGGCVGLISSGVASGPSEFLDASATGADVFFSTGERLVPQDVDGQIDVYDAHECTSGSPCALPSEHPEECRSAGACRAAPQPQPSIFGAPPSALFTSIGNLPPEAPGTHKSAAQIRAEKLSKALATCRHRYKHRRKRRAACEKHAHKAYGAAKHANRAGKSVHTDRRTGR